MTDQFVMGQSLPEQAVPGTLYGIGVGPGDPELITVKGLRLLQSAPVVFVPIARPSGASYARAIAERYLDPVRQQIVEQHFAMRGGEDAMRERWRANAAEIAAHLLAGRDAAFLTEGDPMLYSTFVHVAGALQELRPDLRVVAVPGVSSVFAAASAALLPLADRDERLAVLPASYERDGLRAALETFDTVVLLKVASAIDRVLDLLEELGRTDEAVWVRRCGRPEQEIVREVRSLRGRQLDYFSLMIVRRPV